MSKLTNLYIPDECAVENLIFTGLLTSLVGMLLLFYALILDFPKDYVVDTEKVEYVKGCVADNCIGVFCFQLDLD